MKILNIIFGVLIGALSIAVIVLSITTSTFYHQNINLKVELNQTGQTVQQLKQEVENREKIMAEKDELLEKVKQAKTYPDYIKIWQTIGTALSQ